jgi:subtilisin family serine protease
MSKRSLTTLLSAIAVTAATALSVPTATLAAAPSERANSAAKSAVSNKLYIVRLAESPVTAYKGGIKGYPATKPAAGKKIDPTSSKVVNYMSYLASRHDAVLAAAGGGHKVYSYGYVFNGFTAELTAAQADRVRSMPGVLSVEKDLLRDVDTATTPTFLGLDAPGGLWEQLGGVGSAGENIIIGVIDSGIWPESLSFSDRTGTNGNASKDGKLAYQQIPGWNGKCTPGEAFNASMCNQKLIGAQRFNAAWGGDAGIEALRPWEFTSPRDYDGHGTHTSSTAGGNHGVAATGPGAALGSVTGMAPRARIAMYKALWSTQDTVTASGFTSDLVAAIDQAVADGVDVISYSIAGAQTSFVEDVQVAFLFAADAGVFVAAAAGNAGTTGSVNHPGPWLTTVAAGTHNRNGIGSVTTGDGANYPGSSFASALGSTPIVDSANSLDPAYVHVPVTGIPTAAVAAELCVVGSLDASKVRGKIVLCKRGTTALVDKSRAVATAGGVGAVIYNDPVGATNTLALFHTVPTVHVVAASGLAIKAYIAAQGAAATASIAQSTVVFNVPAPFTATFSSRGPLAAGGGDLLKPDVIAPGQDILAAFSPAFSGLDFNQISGTSMSTPHVAGLAALLMDRHPAWTPMMIKSALMTSATDVLDGANTDPGVIFRQGAGHVRPNSAADPGLVFNHGFNDWLAFLCGTGNVVGATCSTLQGLGFSLDPSDLNVASIAIGDLLVAQTVTRKVTNVSGNAATYRHSVQGMVGFAVTVSPATLTLNPGETKSFQVTFTRSTAPPGGFVGGQLLWSEDGGPHVVRIPLTVRPLALVVPAAVSGTGDPISYTVRFGYDGPFAATPRGLIPAVTTSARVVDDPNDSDCRAVIPPSAYTQQVVIPAGTTYARFALFDAFTDGNPDDLDLCVYRGTGTAVALVGASLNATANETVNLVNPAADTYTVVVVGFDTDGPDSNFTLFHWLLGSASAGNMTVTAPTTAVSNGSGTITLDFSGLTSGTKYLGSVAYGGTTGLPNPTIVRVDTP